VGDARTDVPISGIVGPAGAGGDGVFVRELERALLDGRIDVAVHSLKDMPTAVASGLEVACVPARAMPFDVLVGPAGATLATLPAGAVVGTSSIRRVVQVKAMRPDLVVKPIRGNVDTRLRKLDAAEYDGLILAGAGLERLGLATRITEVLQPPGFWPAIAQGALAVQIRADDTRMRKAVAVIDDPATHAAVLCERACLAKLAGGCLAPIAGWARIESSRLVLGACVFEDTGSEIHAVRAEVSSAALPVFAAWRGAAEALGGEVARRLLEAGANRMLARMRAAGSGTATFGGEDR